MNIRTTTFTCAIVKTDEAIKLDIPDVILDLKCDAPVVWINHGGYRLIPKLSISEFIRLHDQWKLASYREAATKKFTGAIYWDDCSPLDEATAKILTGDTSLDNDKDQPTYDG